MLPRAQKHLAEAETLVSTELEEFSVSVLAADALIFALKLMSMELMAI